MNIAALIRVLGAKGMSADDIADVVELTLPPEEPSRADKKRERDRVRMEAKREGERLSRDMSDNGDVARHGDIPSQGSEEKVSPRPLSKTQPPNLTLEPPISPKNRVPRAKLASDFEVFWEAYPRKVAKGRAEKAFPAAIAKTTLEQLVEAATAMGRNAEDAKYIPHPASWLNDKRWLDSTDPPDGSTSTTFDLAKHFEWQRQVAALEDTPA